MMGHAVDQETTTACRPKPPHHTYMSEKLLVPESFLMNVMDEESFSTYLFSGSTSPLGIISTGTKDTAVVMMPPVPKACLYLMGMQTAAYRGGPWAQTGTWKLGYTWRGWGAGACSGNTGSPGALVRFRPHTWSPGALVRFRPHTWSPGALVRFRPHTWSPEGPVLFPDP
jgi:hypothetical protein